MSNSIRTWANGIAWTMAIGWMCGAVYFALILHDPSRVAYCLISLAGVLVPGIPVTRLQSWLQESLPKK